MWTLTRIIPTTHIYTYKKHFIRQAACQPTHGASVSSEAGGNEQRKKKRNKKEETK
jgi:hypothetical protein